MIISVNYPTIKGHGCVYIRPKLIRSSNMVLYEFQSSRTWSVSILDPACPVARLLLQCVLHIILAFGKVGGNVRG
jgi:hypothetical protein